MTLGFDVAGVVAELRRRRARARESEMRCSATAGVTVGGSGAWAERSPPLRPTKNLSQVRPRRVGFVESRGRHPWQARAPSQCAWTRSLGSSANQRILIHGGAGARACQGAGRRGLDEPDAARSPCEGFRGRGGELGPSATATDGDRPAVPNTSSPIASPRTSAPSSATTPATSKPSVIGGSR